MSESFDAEEGPTRPAAAAAKSKTSRWKAVANTAIQRGFGRLSEGDFDQGNLPDESGTHVVAARSEAETLPAPEPSSSRGPRGTVRIEVPGVRGPNGTMRMAPVRPLPRRIERTRVRARAGWPWWSVAAFAVLSSAVLLALASGRHAPVTDGAPLEVTEQSPAPTFGPSDPPQPPDDFALADAPTPSPQQAPAAQQPASRKHDKKTRAKPPVRTRRMPSGSGVF